LASITGIKDQIKVLKECQRANLTSYCWIGLKRDIPSVGTREGWYWIDGTKTYVYKAWYYYEGIGRSKSDQQNYAVIKDQNEWHDSIECPINGGTVGVCMIPF